MEGSRQLCSEGRSAGTDISRHRLTNQRALLHIVGERNLPRRALLDKSTLNNIFASVVVDFHWKHGYNSDNVEITSSYEQTMWLLTEEDQTKSALTLPEG